MAFITTANNRDRTINLELRQDASDGPVQVVATVDGQEQVVCIFQDNGSDELRLALTFLNLPGFEITANDRIAVIEP